MKLTLTNFGQDVSLSGEPSTVYLVFVDEATGQTYRLPTVQGTITRLAQVLSGVYEGEPALPDQDNEAQEEEEQEKPSEPEGAHVFGGTSSEPEPEDEENESEVPVAVLPKTTLRKKIVPATTSPTRAAIAQVRARLEDHQGEGTAEDRVPGL